MDEFVKDDETEAIQSNGLELIIHGLLLRQNSVHGKRKNNTPNTLSMIEEPTAPRRHTTYMISNSNNITSSCTMTTKTKCSSTSKVLYGKTAKTHCSSQATKRQTVYWCILRCATSGTRSMPYTRTIGSLTLFQRAKI